jgi:hypothetical protein
MKKQDRRRKEEELSLSLCLAYLPGAAEIFHKIQMLCFWLEVESDSQSDKEEG